MAERDALVLALAEATRGRDKAIDERDKVSTAAKRWFDAVIAVTPDHHPFPPGRSRHSSWRNRLHRGSGRASFRKPPFWLAERARETPNWELAVRYYRDALDIEPKNTEIWVRLTEALKETGRSSEAEVVYRICREMTSLTS